MDETLNLGDANGCPRGVVGGVVVPVVVGVPNTVEVMSSDW